MQYVQNLSQPIMIRTYAWYGVGRIAGSRSGSKLSWLRSICSRLPSLRPRLTSIRCVRARLGANLAHQRRHLVQLAGPDDQVDVRRPLENEPLILLGHAAEDADDFARMLALGVLEPAQRAVDLVFRVLADAARVEQDRVGVVRRWPSARNRLCAGWRRRARCRARSSGSRRFRCRVS